HSVDSDEMSFRMAGIQAFRAAAEKLKPVLLEPVMKVTVTVPEEVLGDVMGDINARRGRVLGMEGEGNYRVVTAEVPMAETRQVADGRRSWTVGRCASVVAFDHNVEVSHGDGWQVTAAVRADLE